MTDITELTGALKHANQHRISRLIVEAPTYELRQLAVEVEQYTDQLTEALEKAKQHIARQEQIMLNQDESLSIRRGELEAAQQERENWRTSFDNERFRADKLAAVLNDEIEQAANVGGQLLIAHRTLLNQQAKIAELEEAEQKLCAANVTLDARAELAERQLAELESRTVKLPRPGFITISGERMAVYLKGDVDAAMLAAGIEEAE
ncbi:TPA: hypothetical protein ACK2WW_000342 [Klebsiella michiganensis]